MEKNKKLNNAEKARIKAEKAAMKAKKREDKKLEKAKRAAKLANKEKAKEKTATLKKNEEVKVSETKNKKTNKLKIKAEKAAFEEERKRIQSELDAENSLFLAAKRKEEEAKIQAKERKLTEANNKEALRINEINKKQAEKEKEAFTKKKEAGKCYVLSDFTFKLKAAPNNNKQFKEIVINYSYKFKPITYFYFVRKEFSDSEALKLAKKQVENLIANNQIVDYAKMYYRKLY